MTGPGPGFMAQQAAQNASRAAADSARQAQQAFTQSTHAQHVQRNLGYHSGRRSGGGVLSRFIGFVLTMAVLAVGVMLILAARDQVNSDWVEQVLSWFGGLF